GDPVDDHGERLDENVAALRALATVGSEHGVDHAPCLVAGRIPAFNVVSPVSRLAHEVIALSVEEMQHPDPTLDLAPVLIVEIEHVAIRHRTGDETHVLRAVLQLPDVLNRPFGRDAQLFWRSELTHDALVRHNDFTGCRFLRDRWGYPKIVRKQCATTHTAPV